MQLINFPEQEKRFNMNYESKKIREILDLYQNGVAISSIAMITDLTNIEINNIIDEFIPIFS